MLSVMVDKLCLSVILNVLFTKAVITGNGNNIDPKKNLPNSLDERAPVNLYDKNKERLKWTPILGTDKTSLVFSLKADASKTKHITPQNVNRQWSAEFRNFNRLTQIKEGGYRYIINHRTLCDNVDDKILLILVRSKYDHFSQRAVIRKTWAAAKQFQKMKVYTVFMLGYPPYDKYQKSITVENTIYGDIVQVDIVDSHSKSADILHSLFTWMGNTCMNAQTYLVTKDNVVIDLYKLVPYLNDQFLGDNFSNSFVICNLQSCCGNKNADGQQISEKEAIEADFTTAKKRTNISEFCSSDGYAFSVDVLEKILKIAEDLLPDTSDEIWLSSLVNKAEFHLSNTSEMFDDVKNISILQKQYRTVSYQKNVFIFSKVGTDIEDSEAVIMKHVWDLIQEHRKRLDGRLLYIRSDSDEIMYFTISFMFIDILVVLVIFVVIFMRKKQRKQTIKTKYSISYH